MKIKPRGDILTDIIHAAKKHPLGWNAAFGSDPDRFSHEYYIFHPNVGMYVLKEYQKNPFETQGLGVKLERHIDADIEEQLVKTSSDFGIIQGDIQKILFNIHKGVSPRQIMQGALFGKDLGIQIPVRGHASGSLETFHHLSTMYSSKQKKLTERFEKMVSDDGVYRSYG